MSVHAYKKILLGDSAVYLMSSVIQQAIPFFLLPILTKYLSASDYGIISIFQIAFSILVVLVGINLHGAVSVKFFQMEQEKLPIFIGNTIILIGFSFFLNLLMVLLLSRVIDNEILHAPFEVIFLALVGALFQVIGNISLTVLQMKKQAFKYGLLLIFQSLINLSCSLMLVVYFHLNWIGRVLGLLISLFLLFLFSLYFLSKNNLVFMKINKDYLKQSFFFGIGLVPHALAGWILISVDRIFIADYLGLQFVGIYAVGTQLASIIKMITGSINKAWSPYLFGILSKGGQGEKERIIKITYGYFFLMPIFAIAVALVIKWLIPYLVGSSFWQASDVVLWLAVGNAAEGMYFMVVGYLFYAEKTLYLSGVTCLSALLNICLNFILIKYNGFVGAAQATALTYFCSFIFTWILSARFFDMPWLPFKCRKNT